MKCRQCKRDNIPDNSIFCCWCGSRLVKEKKKETKVPEPRQLKSGSWNIELRKEGISITESSKEKCIAKAIAARNGYIKKESRSGITLTKAIDNYIESKSNVLSPETIRGYKIIQKHRFPGLMEKDVSEITQDMCQKEVNKAAKKLSAKTLKNSWYFCLTVMNTIEPKNITLTLPAKNPKEIQFLSGDQIPLFLEKIKDTDIELFCLLALSSLRRSEIYGLRKEDIDLEQKQIHINGALVYDSEGNRIRKDTNKSEAGRRDVPIFIPRLLELLSDSELSDPLIPISYSAVCRALKSICEAADLPIVTPHGLRHSFASMALITLNMPEKIVMEIGGWKDRSVLQKIYTHASRSELNKRAAQLEEYYTGMA